MSKPQDWVLPQKSWPRQNHKNLIDGIDMTLFHPREEEDYQDHLNAHKLPDNKEFRSFKSSTGVYHDTSEVDFPQPKGKFTDDEKRDYFQAICNWAVNENGVSGQPLLAPGAFADRNWRKRCYEIRTRPRSAANYAKYGGMLEGYRVVDSAQPEFNAEYEVWQQQLKQAKQAQQEKQAQQGEQPQHSQQGKQEGDSRMPSQYSGSGKGGSTKRTNERKDSLQGGHDYHVVDGHFLQGNRGHHNGRDGYNRRY